MAQEHIELSGGIVTWSTSDRAAGRTINAELIGKQRFFVEVVTDDSRYCLWDGADYDEAIRMAEETRHSLNLEAPVRDTVAGGAS